MAVGSQRHAQLALPPGKTRYPLCRRLGWSEWWPGFLRKVLSPPEFDPQTVQPVARYYTAYVIATHYKQLTF
jgi:hypothetical protein